MYSYSNANDYISYLNGIGQKFFETPIGRLKEFQHPWAYSFIKERGAEGTRILEVGSGAPNILKALSKEHRCECWAQDPFEGTGQGPTDFKRIRRKFKNVRFVKSAMGDFDGSLPDGYFDFVFSVSVMEHVPLEDWNRCFQDMARVTKPGGIIFHAIDFRVDDDRGRRMLDKATETGGLEGLEPLDPQVTTTIEEIQNDPCTFYLSPIVWNQWKKIDPGNPFYDTFRRITSLNVAYRKR